MTTPHAPTKYLGPNQFLVPVVSRDREPTGADYRQPETGKLYPIASIWQVGKNPTTGSEGDMWMLSKIVANVAFWILISSGGTPLESFVTNIAGPVVPDGSAQVLVNASVSTFTDGSVANTLKTEVQATDHQILIGNGTNVPVGTITNGVATTLLASNGVTSDPTFQTISSLGIFTQIAIQSFAASGTYTPTTGMKYCLIELVGGGGGGGGTTNTTASTISVGGGGGGGGYARKFAFAATIGASQVVTCGAGGSAGTSGTGGGNGGSSSVGAICIASGGNGGGAFPFAAGVYLVISGGAGGTGSTGDALAAGIPGGVGTGSDTSQCAGGFGGSSFFGGGGIALAGSIATDGAAGTKGGGGSGAFTALNELAKAGGSGGVGYVVITEFI